LSMVEGMRLIMEKDTVRTPEAFGPGHYILFIGIVLVIVALMHIFLHGREARPISSGKTNIERRRKVFCLIAALALYLVLIKVVSYPVATPIFFFLAFWIVGIKSWRFNIVLTLVLSGAYYLVFVRYCNMIFPRVKFFGLFG
jgi:hypothetical protein